MGIALDLGRGGERATVLRPQGPGGTHVARIPGRVVLDGIDTLRAAFWSFESFELETVAQSLLGRGKTIAKNIDKVAEKIYAISELDDWLGARGQVGRLPPSGFPRSNRFS